MKIALIGYGRMGKAIEKIAIERGHEIVAIIDLKNQDLFESSEFINSDVAIEFSVPTQALINYKKCFKYNIPVVSGTTGWLEHLNEIEEECESKKQTFFYASNFSLGVNIFFALNKNLANMMSKFPSYQVSMTETHHVHKLDAPSGTAITLAEGIIENLENKDDWTLGLGLEEDSRLIFIESKREGEVPGTHKILYQSNEDTIEITHIANNRQGFALGAVIAAEYTTLNKGFLSMDKMLNL